MSLILFRVFSSGPLPANLGCQILMALLLWHEGKFAKKKQLWTICPWKWKLGCQKPPQKSWRRQLLLPSFCVHSYGNTNHQALSGQPTTATINTKSAQNLSKLTWDSEKKCSGLAITLAHNIFGILSGEWHMFWCTLLRPSCKESFNKQSWMKTCFACDDPKIVSL